MSSSLASPPSQPANRSISPRARSKQREAMTGTADNLAIRAAQAARRQEAWRTAVDGVTPDIVRRKADKRAEQRARAAQRRAAEPKPSAHPSLPKPSSHPSLQVANLSAYVTAPSELSHDSSAVELIAAFSSAISSAVELIEASGSSHASCSLCQCDRCTVPIRLSHDSCSLCQCDRCTVPIRSARAVQHPHPAALKPHPAKSMPHPAKSMPHPAALKPACKPHPAKRPWRQAQRDVSPSPVAKRMPSNIVHPTASNNFQPKLLLGCVERVTFVSHDKGCCFARDGAVHLDVRNFHDPPTTHDGRNEIVWQKIFTNHPDVFTLLCRRVKEVMRESRQATLVLSFYCNGGKHRSVACAELFGAIATSFGLETEVVHKSLEFHRNRGCACSGCNTDRVNLPEYVADMFRQA
jgi:hypothetical protein